MDAILKRMQANKKSDAEQTMIHPELLRVHEEEISRRNELIQYRERAIRHLKKLMEDESLKFMQYPPMSVFHRNIVASLADEFGLVSHEFGEEEIDRYVIVYKSSHAPSADEIARLTLKHTMKMADETVEKIIAGGGEVQVQQQGRKKVGKVVEEVVDDDVVPAEQLRAVGTVKRVRRNAADVMEEVRLKKRMEKIVAPSQVDEEIDSLFVVADAAAAASSSASTAGAVEWDEEEEF